MSDGVSSIYSVDSNTLLAWYVRYYPIDVFEGLVTRVEELIGQERFFLSELVREETEIVGTAELTEWVDRHRGMVIPTAEVLAEAQTIQGRFPGLLDPKAEHEEADAYVIALARLHDGIVVSEETSAAEKHRPRRSHYIPDVCRELGIPCINFLGLMRREGWRF